MKWQDSDPSDDATSEASAAPPRRILQLAILGLIALGIYAYSVEIDQVTRAKGRVIAIGRTQVVQASEVGIVRQIAVKEGDLVEEGQVLATLEKSRAQAAFDDASGRVAALRVTIARLRAEMYGHEPMFPADLRGYRELIENQRNLYQRRRVALMEDIAAFERIRAVAQSELAMNEALLATGDVGRADVLRLNRQIAEVNAQITAKRNKYFQDAQAEMTKAQEELNAQTEQLVDRRQVLEQTELIAPARGYVKNLNINTLGGVIKPGEIAMELLPVDDRLIVEAHVLPADLAFIRIGQEAAIKLDAFDFSIFGGYRGTVEDLSPDTVSENSSNGVTHYYRVNIAIGEKEFNGERALPLKVIPGMTAQVDMLAMRRTLMSYLVNPVSKLMVESLKPI